MALMWSIFGLAIVGMLVIDLGIANRKSHELSIKEASMWTVVWIAAALLFNLGIHHFLGTEQSLEFLTGYLIEKSLSLDNIFVFILIFSYFDVKPEYQPRVLKWGIIGAVVMRGILIAGGVVLIHRFHWMSYVFGGLLLFTVVKMILLNGEKFDPGDNLLLRLFRRIMPITSDYRKDKFVFRHGRTLIATPLLLVVIVIESSDLVFAMDSIPAIFAVTSDPFIVYTSNIFAILGLRALFFVIAGMVRSLAHLKPGIILILLFVAVKMLIADFYQIPIVISLLVIGGILSVSIVISLLFKRAPEPEVTPPVQKPLPGFQLNTRPVASDKLPVEQLKRSTLVRN